MRVSSRDRKRKHSFVWSNKVRLKCNFAIWCFCFWPKLLHFAHYRASVCLSITLIIIKFHWKQISKINNQCDVKHANNDRFSICGATLSVEDEWLIMKRSHFEWVTKICKIGKHVRLFTYSTKHKNLSRSYDWASDILRFLNISFRCSTGGVWLWWWMRNWIYCFRNEKSYVTNVGIRDENRMPEKIPEMSMAAAIIPALIWYCEFVCDCGAYIIPNELR